MLQNSIHGIEKKPLPHLLATTNMFLHGIEIPVQIRHDNTLANSYTSWTPEQRVDVIITNPPFGGMEELGIESGYPKEFQTRETADLFMVLIIRLLKENGRAAVVLPDGFLFGEGMKNRLKENYSPTATCTPLSDYPMACSVLTRASKQIYSFSPKANRLKPSGFMSILIPKA